MKKTKGLIAAPLTGYRADGSVDLDVVPQYAEMLKAGGLSGVFVNGTTGEGMSLSMDERIQLAERWVATKSDQFRVIIHVGYAGHDVSFKLAEHAVKIGADAIGEIGPKDAGISSVAALVDYMSATAEKASVLPYYYYHMPSVSNVLFPMVDVLAEAASRIPNLAGLKYTYEDLDDYERCVQFEDGRYDVMFGRDELLIDSLRRGAHGAVGSTYNLMGPLYGEIIKAFKAGDGQEAERLQAVSIKAIDLLVGTGGFFSALKTVIAHMGIDLGKMRAPNIDLTDDVRQQLLKDLADAGVFEYLNNKS